MMHNSRWPSGVLSSILYPVSCIVHLCHLGLGLLSSTGVSLKISIDFNERIDFLYKFRSYKWNPLFLRFTASAATLSGSIGKGILAPSSL